MNLSEVTIIDVGYGNIESIVNLYGKYDITVQIANSERDILQSRRLLIPGVGNFKYASSVLAKSGLKPAIIEMASVNQIPVLGVCLGMQLLSNRSEEGGVDGLGLIPGAVKRFSPITSADGISHQTHMGWEVLQSSLSSFAIRNKFDGSRYYFAHSYWFDPEDPEIVEAFYGLDSRIPAVVKKQNIVGAQFHPERSGKSGVNFLLRFATANDENWKKC